MLLSKQSVTDDHILALQNLKPKQEQATFFNIGSF